MGTPRWVARSGGGRALASRTHYPAPGRADRDEKLDGMSPQGPQLKLHRDGSLCANLTSRILRRSSYRRLIEHPGIRRAYFRTTASPFATQSALTAALVSASTKR